MLAMRYEMGATAAMSSPGAYSSFALIHAGSVVMRPHFLANFTVMPNCEIPIRVDSLELPGESTPLPEPRKAAAEVPIEIGGRDGPEPTRFGDWELRGRCIDF
jgi:hypothetical protein